MKPQPKSRPSVLPRRPSNAPETRHLTLDPWPAGPLCYSAPHVVWQHSI